MRTGPWSRRFADLIEVPVGRAEVTRFSDGEIYVEIGENVRGVNCFVVQPTCSPAESAPDGAADHDRCAQARIGRLASSRSCPTSATRGRIARSSRARRSRAKLVADLITAAGADRVLAMDLHAGQIQGFFDIPFDHLFAMPVLIEYMRAPVRCAIDRHRLA